MHRDVERVLFSQEQIAQRVSELAAALSAEYQGRNPLCIGVLKGSVFFMADLLRQMDTMASMDFMILSSYGQGSVSQGKVKIVKDLDVEIVGRDVIIVEDIIDTGHTLAQLMKLLDTRHPASIKLVTLLDKPARREVSFVPDLCGFTVPDEFLVGYGLDYAERYRNLPYIGVLKRAIYE